MFISNFEKARINSRIQSLEICVDNLTKALNALSNKPKKTLTPEQKERQRAYVRAYNARKKAEKAQQVAA